MLADTTQADRLTLALGTSTKGKFSGEDKYRPRPYNDRRWPIEWQFCSRILAQNHPGLTANHGLQYFLELEPFVVIDSAVLKNPRQSFGQPANRPLLYGVRMTENPLAEMDGFIFRYCVFRPIVIACSGRT